MTDRPMGETELAEQLRQVLTEAGDQIEPGPHAYARLAEKVVLSHHEPRWWQAVVSPTSVRVAAAAAIFVVAVVGLVTIDRSSTTVQTAAPEPKGDLDSSNASQDGQTTAGPDAENLDPSADSSRVSTGFDGGKFQVVRIGADDPDDGLVLRESPGVQAPSVSVLPPGSIVQRLDGGDPVVVGIGEWWEVESDDGTRGWVSAAYLATTGRSSTSEINRLALSVMTALAQANDPDGVPLPIDGYQSLPPGSGLTIEIGSARSEFRWLAVDNERWLSRQRLLLETIWGQSFESVSGQSRMSAVEIGDPDFRTDDWFGRVDRVPISYLDDEGTGRRVEFVIRPTSSGPLLVGIITDIDTG